MKRIYFLLLFGIIISCGLYAQRGIHGPRTVTAANTIVNEYTAITAFIPAGSTSITVANSGLNANGRYASNLVAGDLIMIYQAQGAIIKDQSQVANSADTTWGKVVSPGDYYSTGLYEFRQVLSVPNATTINIDCGTTNTYIPNGGTARKPMVIRVPRYTSLTVNSGGVLTCDDWNGTVGGILAVEVQGNMVVNAGGSVDATGRGFRGGSLVGDNATSFGVNTTFSTNSSLGAEKGEGVAGYQAEYDVFGGRYCRAPGANGGGGGDGHNAGGGGGANAPNSTSATAYWSGNGIPDQTGTGWTTAWSIEPPAGTMNLRTTTNSAGGGRGGYTFCGSNQNATTVPPGNAAWGGDARNHLATGLGGRPLDYSTGRLFLGGGGGAGDQNNSGGGIGGDGGGLCYMMVFGNISGSGTFVSNGTNGANGQGGTGVITGIDAGGGGGAGGTIVLNAIGGVANTLTINTNGGNGGNQVVNLPFSTNEGEGPGGGGGGGYIAVSSGSPTRNSNGGNNGTTNSAAVTEFIPNGATRGCPGTNNALISNFNITLSNQTICTGSSINITATVSGTLPPGAVINWYTAATGGSPIFTGTTYNTGSLSSTTTYWVGTCAGWWRTPVTITVGPGGYSGISLPDVTGSCSATATAPTATELCSGTIVTGTTSTTFPITTQGTTIVTWTFNDGAGHIATANQNVIVDDVTAPVTPTLANVTGQCSATPSVPTTTDVCAGTITGTTSTTFPITTQGTTVVTWTFNDGNGNSTTANQNVILDDVTAPVTPTLANVTGQCSATPSVPTTTDVCAGTITGTTSTTFPITTQGTTVVTWTFNDGNGNSTTANQNVILDDVTAPVSPTLVNVTGQCSATPSTPTTTDVCSGTIIGTTSTTFPITTQGTTVVTWTFNDGNGNSTTANQNVILDDVTAPVSPTLVNVTGQCSATPSTPTTTDVCAGTITGTTSTTFPITTQGTTVVTWTFDDGNGNSTTATQNVIIDDVTSPVAPTLADVTDECSVTPSTPTTTDACAGTITGTTSTTFPVTTQGTTVVTWTFDDGNGNSTTATQNVIIDDVTSPVAPTLADVTDECSVTPSTPTTTDACAGTITGTTSTTFPVTTQGTTVVTWTFDDGNGNSTTANQNVILDDVTAPVSPTLVNVTGQCSATPSVPTTTDVCAGTIIGTTSTTFPITTQGTTVVTWTFDDGNGNSTTGTQNVIIDDVTSPVAPTLADVTDECSVTPSTPTTTDACAGTITGTTSTTFPITTQGTTVVTWTFDDGNGNSTTATQNVIIDDVTAPITPALADVTAECSATPSTPTTTDACAGTIIGTTSTTFPITTQGTTVVTWTFDDGNGNSTTATQNVIIDDVTAPVTPALADVTAECSTSPGMPTTTDACVGTITGTTLTLFPITTQGTTVVTWTFDDGNGNSTTADQNVIISIPDLSTSLAGMTITAADTTADTYQWIDCNASGAIISGAASYSYTASVDGSYAVIITTGTCSDTSACVIINSVSVMENTSGQILIYPNPTGGQIDIQLGETYEQVELLITDLSGRTMQQNIYANTSALKVDLKGDKGIYLIYLTSGDRPVGVMKVVKN